MFSFSSILLNNSEIILLGTSEKIYYLNWTTGEYLNSEIPIINALSFMELPDS